MVRDRDRIVCGPPGQVERGGDLNEPIAAISPFVIHRERHQNNAAVLKFRQSGVDLGGERLGRRPISFRLRAVQRFDLNIRVPVFSEKGD